MTPTVVHEGGPTWRHGDATAFQTADSSTQRWQRSGLIVSVCVNAASVGNFVVVFVGLIAFPVEARKALFLLALGSVALAVLIMGQRVHWSRLALRSVRERR